MRADPVIITDSAREYINQRCDGGTFLVSIRINNKGCSGHSYEYGLIEKHNAKRFDEVILWTGGGIVIDAASVMHLLGSTLGLKTSIMESYLYWENPQAVDPCGCGTSFALTI
jgi:iron-sulfur cluster assembly protein